MKKPVALFITCLTDQFYPNVGIAVTKVLDDKPIKPPYVSALRVGIAPMASCAAAFDAPLARVLTKHGCQAVLRAQGELTLRRLMTPRRPAPDYDDAEHLPAVPEGIEETTP